MHKCQILPAFFIEKQCNYLAQECCHFEQMRFETALHKSDKLFGDLIFTDERVIDGAFAATRITALVIFITDIRQTFQLMPQIQEPLDKRVVFAVHQSILFQRVLLAFG